MTERIAEVTPAGVRTEDGTERPADVLVLGDGLQGPRLRGADGDRWRRRRTLAEEWADVPRAYLGMSVPGFPNMFLIYGPNTNGGTGSVIDTVESGMGHVLAALEELERAARSRIELRREKAAEFDRELRAALAGSVWHTGCTSWYVDENGNDPNQWPWLWSAYRRRTARLEPGAYELSARPAYSAPAADASAR